jgi:hypothetical protein
MRINRDILLKIARDTVERESRTNRDLLSAYLIGSLLEAEPLLGGATDIDLVYVWNSAPPAERTVQGLTEQVHLDIVHHSRTLYRQPRRLRQHPWIGPDVARATVLYDPQHFMDFTQASVRGQFDRSENVLERAQRLAEQGRQAWLRFATQVPEATPQVINDYLGALEDAANAAASLNGAPLAERRFLLLFKERMERLERQDLYSSFLGLCCGPQFDLQEIPNWLPAWSTAFENMPVDGIHPAIQPERRGYYVAGAEDLLESDLPQAALWPILRSWTRMAVVRSTDESTLQGWQNAFSLLGLLGEDFTDRIQALDAFLDSVEEAIENWGRRRGVW